MNPDNDQAYEADHDEPQSCHTGDGSMPKHDDNGGCQSSRNSRANDMNPPPHTSLMSHLPKRNKRSRDSRCEPRQQQPPMPPRANCSMLHLSRSLVQYFDICKQAEETQKEHHKDNIISNDKTADVQEPPPKKPRTAAPRDALEEPALDAPVEEEGAVEGGQTQQQQQRFHPPKGQPTLVIEEALEFSKQPRVMVEASRPHRVVHMNAAYLYHIRPLLAKTTTAKEFASVDDAAQALAPPTGQCAVVIPVWGAEGAVITHVLMEWKNEPQQSEPLGVVG